ncbi:Hypothetical predicted protein [Podarcis lilfordi]|uniref:Uncharacterized protein n=1 Tax=Podarcis lilfordi TaxID=74358 RepID=A0AA35PMJ1_9SAUR|nr:Hypothetical predicted protein [Podarcis lilfordi]
MTTMTKKKKKSYALTFFFLLCVRSFGVPSPVLFFPPDLLPLLFRPAKCFLGPLPLKTKMDKNFKKLMEVETCGVEKGGLQKKKERIPHKNNQTNYIRGVQRGWAPTAAHPPRPPCFPQTAPLLPTTLHPRMGRGEMSFCCVFKGGDGVQ